MEHLYKLLKLCDMAQEKGHNVQFQYAEHKAHITHYVPGKGGIEMIAWLIVKIEGDAVNEAIARAEAYLEELI